MTVHLADLQAMDFRARRPGNVDPGTCPACAMVVEVLYAAVDEHDPHLVDFAVELGALHALLGHPGDHRPERKNFLSQTLGRT